MGKDDDPLDRGLAIYFGREGRRADDSVISAIEKVHGPVSRIMLRDEGSDTVPPIRVPGLTADTLSIEDDRYMVLGEIARGGVGVIYRSRDVDLGREIALKVIRNDLVSDSAVVERFIEEAQIGGQLQHPGIVPVYGLGLQSDGRPFFAMKFVKGQTLSALLQSRKTPADELRRFTLVFKTACETVAYAHARGVVHRDLKPSNVMVGAFGEVQVVDWGFAKVLGRKDTARDRPDGPPIDASVIATIRSEREGSQSVAGSVMGTPAYMPPEQALGQVDELDERSDVFALGAILTEILTGKPPYVGEGKECLIMAARSNLDDAYERLAESPADEALIELTKACLAPLKRDRPKDAGDLTKRLVAYLSGVEERARREEVEAAEEKARAERERLRLVASRREAVAAAQSRRRSIILAACVLVAVLGAGTALFTVLERRRGRATRANAAVAAALSEASGLRGEEEWDKAFATLGHAAGLAQAGGADPEWAEKMVVLRREVSRAKDDADREAARLERDDAFADRLEAIGLQNWQHVGREQVDSQYTEAFRSYGADIDGHRPEEAAAVLRGCSRTGGVVIGLAGWAYLQPKLLYREDNWPADVLLEVERDETRREMWRAVVELDLETLLRFTEDPEVFDLPPVALSLLGHALMKAEVGDARAARFLRDAWARHPDDVRLLTFLENATDARLYGTAAMALRPRTAEVRFLRGTMLEEDGQEEEALQVWREILDLEPESASFVAKRIAKILEEREDFEGAISTYKKGIENARDREEESAHRRHLSLLLSKRGRPKKALAQAEKAVEVGEGLWSQEHANEVALAGALIGNGRGEDARAILEEDVDGWVRHRCGMLGLLTALYALDEDYDAAVALVDRAIEHRPDADELWLLRAGYLTARDPDQGQQAVTEAYERFPERETVFRRLAELLEARGAPGHEVAAEEDDKSILRCPDCGRRLATPAHLDDAIEFCRRHLERYPDFPYAHLILGKYLVLKGEAEDGEFHLERGLRLRRYDAYAQEQVSWLRRIQERYDEAVAAAKRAVELAPKRHMAHLRLAEALAGMGDGFHAGQSFRRAWELNATPHMLQHLNQFLLSSGRGYERIQVLRAARERMPGASWIAATLGVVLHQEQQTAAAVDVLEEALEADPRGPWLWYRLGIARLELSRTGSGLEALGEAIRRAAEYEGMEELLRAARSQRVRLFMVGNEQDRALQEVKALLALDPESFRAMGMYAELLRRSGRLREVVDELEAGFDANPKDPALARRLGLLHLQGTGDRERARAVLREAAELDPESGRGQFLFGSLLASAGEHERAEAVLRSATGREFPEQGMAWHELGSVLARRGAVAEALSAHGRGYALDRRFVSPDHVRCLILTANLEGAVTLARRAVALGHGREPPALLDLADALRLTGELREAEELEERAWKLAPDSPLVLRSKVRARFREGRFAEAAAALRSLRAAARQRPGHAQAVEREIALAEAVAAISDRWKEVSSAAFVPKDASEAHLCFVLALGEDHMAVAARFGEKVIEFDPSVGPGSPRYHEYARAALQAGSWEGLDAIDTTDEEAARLRGVALSWFRALLEDRRRRVGDRTLPRRAALPDVAVWKIDDALAGLREDSALKRFPEGEVEAWQEFWKDVDAFHRQLLGEE